MNAAEKAEALRTLDNLYEDLSRIAGAPVLKGIKRTRQVVASAEPNGDGLLAVNTADLARMLRLAERQLRTEPSTEDARIHHLMSNECLVVRQREAVR